MEEGKLSFTIPARVTSIGDHAFAGCKDLEYVYVEGNAPSLGNLVFAAADKAVVHYEPGTSGWRKTFGGRPTALCKPDEQDIGLDRQ